MIEITIKLRRRIKHQSRRKIILIDKSNAHNTYVSGLNLNPHSGQTTPHPLCQIMVEDNE